MKDMLFLLPADFEEGGRPWYCRECAEVRGLLAYYPRLAELLDIRLVDFARPRAAIVDLLGEAHQNAPTLIIAGDPRGQIEHVPIKEANGHRFIDSAKAIGEYLAVAYGIGQPRP